ncbi:MAG: efflux RND transporter permease subunit [Desulfobacterales bacterium]|nr:efflux RND transporter permease subunit [Desulfobacterales bacterium]
MKRSFLGGLTNFSLDRPKTVIGLAIICTVFFGIQFPRITIDTDPENMLKENQPDRVLYNRIKKDFGIHDLIVAGIVDKKGIFSSESLERVAKVTSEILKIKGVIIEDVVSLTTTDNVKSSGGLLDIHPVMREIPGNSKALDQLRRDIAENPFLYEKIASADGSAVALYIPIQKKNMSYGIAKQIQTILDRELLPGQTYHLAGLPVAEDTFGHEMFIQMAVVAPLAFMVIMILVFLLFRKIAFLLPIGMDAMFAVIWAMGLLIGTGNTVHIMSSMIPVFLMPIAILDDIHILSEFFDKYRILGDKRRALLEGMQQLYRPMLFTSLTSAAGFASLALADIPPVRVFGLFVAFGIMAAWLFSMTMVPAVISLMSEEKLKTIVSKERDSSSIFDRILKPIGRLAFSRARTVLILAIVVVAAGIAGIMQIRINDNPVKWFKKGHPMRVADTVMNRLFGGTYMAYLAAEGKNPETMQRPEVVTYLDRIQTHLERNSLVGKTSSVSDIVKRINLVLHDNSKAYNKVPDTSEAVGQFLFLFQSSGDPNDLDNFVDREARQANIWIQMKGGDNQQMTAVESDLESFVKTNPLPEGVTLHWSGLTYINKVWQDLMVFGMLKAILGSFIVVFVLMVIEFRSPILGILSMVPLSVSILLSYGLMGWVGKDYDMPIAVCSSLSLGLGIDFAIHFIERFQTYYAKTGNLDETNRYMFGEPGRAIARNAIVISLGFLPLVASSLTPYVTVGAFFALLMAFSTISTLFLLPAALRVVGPGFLKGGKS